MDFGRLPDRAATRATRATRATSAPAPMLALASLALLAAPAAAHERDFTLSRDWHLPYAGENELESRTFWRDRGDTLTQQFELEHGVTDHFAIEPGFSLAKRRGKELELEAADFELRFNFRDFGYDKLLPAINIEGERRLKHEREFTLDGKLEPRGEGEVRSILSWYTSGGDDFTLNFNVGRGVGGGEHELESELTGGWVRDVALGFSETTKRDHPLRAGFEFTQGLKEEHLLAAGPVVAWRASEHLHVLAAGLVALNERRENADQLRIILEWEF